MTHFILVLKFRAAPLIAQRSLENSVPTSRKTNRAAYTRYGRPRCQALVRTLCVHVIMRPHTARRPTNKSEMVWHALYVRRLMAWTVVNSVFTVVSILYSFNIKYRATKSRLDRPAAPSDACNGQAMLDTVSVSTGATKIRVMDVAPDKDWEDGATAFLFPLPDPVGSSSPRHAPGTDHLFCSTLQQLLK